MAKFNLPSSTDGYPTQNTKVRYRIEVDEAYSDSNGKQLKISLFAYRTDSGQTTDGRGTAKIYINNNLSYSKSFAYGKYKINNSGVYIIKDVYVSAPANAQKVIVQAVLSIPNTTVGTSAKQGGEIDLTKYTLTFNANGVGTAPSAITKAYGTSVTLGSIANPSSGYSFLGWSTSSTATKATYPAGSKYTITKNITLYAVWSISATYTLTYNANGGTNPPSKQTGIAGSTITLSNAYPERDNYSFVGWSASKSSVNSEYAIGGSYTINANTTLYAVWVENYCSIHYDANRGTGAPKTQIEALTSTITLSDKIPTRKRHTFLGWGLTAEATEVVYQPGDTYTGGDCILLYAIWQINDDSTYIYKDGHIETVDFTELTYSEETIETGEINKVFSPQNTYAQAFDENTTQEFYLTKSGTINAYEFIEI